jgi:hypothetical protein
VDAEITSKGRLFCGFRCESSGLFRRVILWSFLRLSLRESYCSFGAIWSCFLEYSFRPTSLHRVPVCLEDRFGAIYLTKILGGCPSLSTDFASPGLEPLEAWLAVLVMLKPPLEWRKFSCLVRFSCQIELFPMQFLRDSCEIPAFRRRPKLCVPKQASHASELQWTRNFSTLPI